MHRVLQAACGLWLSIGLSLGAAGQASADPAVVVELYTSQGCSSCPPADAFLAMLAADDRVIPLALHVDYWDYIGWADSFANPRFTERQKAYARAAGSKTIYTPQIIINGQDRIEGNQPEIVTGLIGTHLAAMPQVALRLTRQGDELRIEADPVALPGPVRVQLVRYMPQQTVAIAHGENAGHTLRYHNIVTSWQALGPWTGAAPLDLRVPAPGPDPVVVILQAEGPRQGPAQIVAAERLR